MPQARIERDELGTPKRWRRGTLIALVITTGGFATAFTGCTYLVATWTPDLGFHFDSRPRLKPIPVPRTACPYLRQVHDTASVAGQASGAATFDTRDGKRWSASAMLLSLKLQRFDLALRSAAPHVPTPIAARLEAVNRQVDIGVSQLPLARTGSDWSARTADAVFSGYSSLSDASDLTGNACGFTVAPSSEVFFNSFTGPRA
jgi:hypothetical protein